LQIYLGELDEMKNEVLELVVIELFSDICPHTCENFIELCKGFDRNGKKFSYVDTMFDRVVKG